MLLHGPMRAAEFPRLYRLALKKKISVANLSKNGDWNSINWDCLFVRPLLDRELLSLESVKSIISASFVKSDLADGLFSSLGSKSSPQTVSEPLMSGLSNHPYITSHLIWHKTPDMIDAASFPYTPPYMILSFLLAMEKTPCYSGPPAR
ncbi:hypothetical protein V6N12_002673 [Hibiscus sabdariffa]|uniref:Uncharacterized protein n=1 Tax=Hibiscus sabdariffa TaxID=183260 RepID=A0ABR2E9N3_9ROSI